MKLFIVSFLKERQGLIISYTASIGFFIASLLLQHVEFNKITYPIILSVFIFMVYMGSSFYKSYKRYKELMEIRLTMDENEPKFPEAESIVEWEYQKSISKYGQIKSSHYEKLVNQIEEHKSHVTMWAHQIKTPITALNLIADRVPDAERKELKSQLFEVENYVDTMMQFVRMDSLNSDLVIKKTSLDSIINESVVYFSRIFIGRHISLKKGEINAIVTTDDKWTVFVVKQILSNALKYSEDGSQIKIYKEEDEKNIYLIIQDFGVGIDKGDIPRLFELGFTGYNGHRDKKATGIGLYLSSQILRRLGHTIRIESELGKGTKVIIGFSKFNINN